MTLVELIRKSSDEDIARILTAIILKGFGFKDQVAFNVKPNHLLKLLQTDIEEMMENV